MPLYKVLYNAQGQFCYDEDFYFSNKDNAIAKYIALAKEHYNPKIITDGLAFDEVEKAVNSLPDYDITLRLFTINTIDINPLDVIVKYGLSVRQIPQTIRELYDMRHHTPMDEIYKEKVKSVTPDRYEAFKASNINSNSFLFDDVNRVVTRRYVLRHKIPASAGKWMCKQVNSSDTLVRWDIKTDNLADTLQESVNLFLAGLTDDGTPQ